MGKLDGFEVMDVSTAVVHDPKIRRLAREAPELLGAAFLAYMAVMAESWKAGERLTIQDAWPSFLPFDPAVVEKLRQVELLDVRGRVRPKPWREFFESAKKRREAARERWRRANENRTNKAEVNGKDRAYTAKLPRGNRAYTAATVPSVSSKEEKRDSPPYPPRRGGSRNGSTKGLTDYEALVVTDAKMADEDPDWMAKP